MEMVDVLRQDFEARKHRAYQPSWCAEPIYYDPLTVEEVEIAQKGGVSTNEQNLRLLIKKAKKADGTPVFQSGQLHWLKTSVAQDRLLDLLDGLFGGVPATAQAQAAVDRDPSSGAASPSP